jgi:mycothiol system anti-sigma-R factor
VSCGEPHETPCDQVLEDVYTYLDAECDQVNSAKIKQHLHECSPCLQEFGIEQEVKALVHRCCGGETAPDSLRERLRAKLRALDVTSVEVTTVEVGGATFTSVDVTEIEIRER